MQVRLAKKTDREFITGIAARCLNAAREAGEYLENESCFLLVSEHGFAAVMVNIDTADLLDIAVLSDFRKCGEGAALMDAVEAECKARGVGQIFLEVRTTNTPAISLYLGCGFEQISIRKKYYSDPVCDAVIMRKTI